MKRKNALIVRVEILVILTAMSFLLYGHGIQLTAAKKYPCIVANAKYHGSRGLADANVIIRFENQEFQKGKTDKNGNFCFYPDQTGKWMVTVDDGLGHLGKVDVTIANDFFEVLPKPTETGGETKVPSPSQSTPQTQKTEEKPAFAHNGNCCYFLKIVLGALLILVITFIMYHWQKRKKNKNMNGN